MASAKKNKIIDTEKKLESGLASFVERPVPDEDEVEDFERAVRREVKDREIDSHLLDVYSDKKGKPVDVGRMKIKKKRHPLLSFLRKLSFFALIILVAYFVYDNYIDKSGDISAMKMSLSGPEKVIAGEEFTYLVEYSNPTKYVLSEIELEMQYPDNFVFVSASISPISGNSGYKLPDLQPGEKASFSVVGNIINLPDSANLAVARLSYLPGSFSSRYTKESSVSTIISGLGFSVDFESASAIFVGSNNELKLFFSESPESLSAGDLSDFEIAFSFKDGSGAEIDLATSSVAIASSTNISASSSEEVKPFSVSKLAPYVWQVGGMRQGMDRQEAVFNYNIKQKIEDFSAKVVLRRRIGERDYIFWEREIKPELVSSDLNLTVFVNGSKNDQPVDFGKELNYSINYSNKGSKTYQDVVIMAVVSGDLVDWSSADLGGGIKNGNTISWTKNELSELSDINSNEEGEINFRLKMRPYDVNLLGQDTAISSYAQYGVGGKASKGEGNKSNTINSPINSDLSLREEIRYFDNDNVPVGSGPLPPKVGEKTSFRVYWILENNLHELREAKAVFSLPAYVSFAGKETTDVGGLRYDSASRQIIWDIGLLPVSRYRAEASFDISISPSDNDRDKILVLSPGSSVSAIDSDTGGLIERKTSAKTSKLEDDDIAGLNNSGRVQ